MSGWRLGATLLIAGAAGFLARYYLCLAGCQETMTRLARALYAAETRNAILERELAKLDPSADVLREASDIGYQLGRIVEREGWLG